MTYPTIVGIQCAEVSTNVTTGQIPIPAGNPGDLLLCFVNTGTVGDRRVTVPSGWTLVAEYTEGDTLNGRYRTVLARVAVGDEGATVEFTHESSHNAVQTYRIRNWFGDIATGLSFVVNTSSSSSGPTLNHGWGTVDALWVFGTQYGSTDRTASKPVGSDWSDVQVCSNDSDGSTAFLGVVTVHRELTAEEIASFSASTVIEWSATPQYRDHFMVAVRPGDSGDDANYGIRITDIKEPNEADTLVTGVTNARVKVWIGTDDSDWEDDISSNQVIENGVLEVTVSETDGFTLNDDIVVTCDWDAGGGEHKFFRYTTTVIDMDA